MAEGQRGVPIDGFLSAQLAELWAVQFVFGDKREHVCQDLSAALQPSPVEPGTAVCDLSLRGGGGRTLACQHRGTPAAAIRRDPGFEESGIFPILKDQPHSTPSPQLL